MSSFIGGDKVNSSEDVGKAFKAILERLNNVQNDKPKERTHICSNCKFCIGQEGYDQQWGMMYCIHSWCEKGLMDSYKNKSHYTTPCSEFEEGNGKYIKMTDREKRRIGI